MIGIDGHVSFLPPRNEKKKKKKKTPAPCFFFSGGGRQLTCPSMPIISALEKTDKANYRRVSGPQHILPAAGLAALPQT